MMATISAKDLLSQNAFNAAKFLRAYKECSKEIQLIVDEMIEIVADDSIDWDDRTHAVDVIIEALFPSLAADFVALDERDMQSAEAIAENEKLDREESLFADNLRELMEERGMTQQSLAELTGVNQPAISNMLNRNCRPQRGTVVRFAKALEVSPEDLWPAE